MIKVRTTADRRLEIRDFISMKRHTSIKELRTEFGVSKSTILRNLEAITETTSIYTTPGNGGGIHANDGWYAINKYLTENDVDFLRMVLETRLQTEEEKESMERIIAGLQTATFSGQSGPYLKARFSEPSGAGFAPPDNCL